MTGTLINVATILVGGGLGLLMGGRFSERLRQTVMAGLGIFTLVIGLQMALKTQNSLIVLASLLIGALLGEWWQIENAIANMGTWLERHFAHSEDSSAQARFVRGFLTASLLFCVGPMAILGSIQDGLTGDFSMLAIKAVLDGFAALAFASSLGVGVLFSALPILIYQGGITLLAGRVQAVMSTTMMNEMSAVGGLILMAVALSSLLEIKQIRAGNFLPALAAAPLIVAGLGWLGIAVK